MKRKETIPSFYWQTPPRPCLSPLRVEGELQIDEDLQAVINAGCTSTPHKAGRSLSPAQRIAKMVGLNQHHAARDVRHNGLDRIQGSLAWLCRYNNMMRGRK